MKKHFVKVSNTKRFHAGIVAVDARGAMEAGWMLVTGEAGYGKSLTVDHWAAETGAVFLRAKVEWTPHYFFTELATAMGIDTRCKAKELFSRLTGVIGEQQVPLIIDEIEHALKDNAKVLEALRDLTDLTETTAVLVGMDQAQSKISKHLQISSRIAHVVTFLPASNEDVRLVCNELAEVAIDDDVVAEINKQANGRIREILNAIATVERIARRSGKDQISRSDLVGQQLTHDWLARRPRVVKTGGSQ